MLVYKLYLTPVEYELIKLAMSELLKANVTDYEDDILRLNEKIDETIMEEQ